MISYPHSHWGTCTLPVTKSWTIGDCVVLSKDSLQGFDWARPVVTASPRVMFPLGREGCPRIFSASFWGNHPLSPVSDGGRLLVRLNAAIKHMPNRFSLFAVATALGIAPWVFGQEVRVHSITRTNDSAELQWHSDTNFYYNIWFSDSLTTANPRFVPINLRGTGGVLSWTDAGDPESVPPRVSPKATSQRFYRILQTGPKIDKFGIIMRYRSATNGKSWYSTWDNLHSRSWVSFVSKDPYDLWFHTDHGDAAFYADGNGILSISPKGTNSTPRMHVHDPLKIEQWHHGVECTVYAMRVSDDGVKFAYAGIEIIARTNHEEDEDLCDCRGIGGRMRLDGHTDFEKETSHPYSTAVSNQVQWPKLQFPDGMPKGVWIGCKFVVYDLTNGNVRLELWLDETDGANGGDWKLVNQFIDLGSNFGIGGTNCAPGTPGVLPTMKLTESESRDGSESRKPNLTIRFRTDGVHTNGMLYKKASVREITP